MISTDGKFLIAGQLNFLDNEIQISGKLYADLSQVTSGKVTVLFLADAPVSPQLLTIYGKLQMGFENAVRPAGHVRRRPADRDADGGGDDPNRDGRRAGRKHRLGRRHRRPTARSIDPTTGLYHDRPDERRR